MLRSDPERTLRHTEMCDADRIRLLPTIMPRILVLGSCVPSRYYFRSLRE